MMNLRDEFEDLSHAEKVWVFVGSIAVGSFVAGVVVGSLVTWMMNS